VDRVDDSPCNVGKGGLCKLCIHYVLSIYVIIVIRGTILFECTMGHERESNHSY
jgi:hypothetical protein